MTIRYRTHGSVRDDGPWSQRMVVPSDFGDWYRRWRHDFAVEVMVRGNWMPGHDYMAQWTKAA